MGKGSTDAVKLFFDGGCRPNPGAIETAVVVRGETYLTLDHGEGDNHTAEWCALFDALAVAARLGLSDIVLIGDSRGVVDKAIAPVRRSAAQRRFDALAAGFARVHVRHVSRSHNLAGIALAARHPR